MRIVDLSWKVLRAVGRILGRAAVRLYHDDGFGRASQMAYNAFFSVFPALLILSGIVNRLGSPGLIDVLMRTAERHLPAAMIEPLETNLRLLVERPLPGAFTSGSLLLLWVASNFLNAVLKGLSDPYPDSWERHFLIRRLMALAFVVILGVTAAISFNLFVFGVQIAREVETQLGVGPSVSSMLRVLRWPFVFLIMSFSTMLFYAIAPKRRLRFRDALPGAVTFSLVWLLTTVAFTFYVRKFANVTRVYGAVAGIILLLSWFYLSSLLLFYGGEVNAAWIRLRNGDPD